MADTPTPDELARFHRWFAIEANNGAWKLAAQELRTEDELLSMLAAAHTAAFHWAHAGGPIHGARADVTLAHVYSLAQEPDLAMRYARRALAFFTEHPDDGEDWDHAFAHAEVAFAAAVAGDAALHAEHYTTAHALGHAIADDEDREVFLAELARIPQPHAQ